MNPPKNTPHTAGFSEDERHKNLKRNNKAARFHIDRHAQPAERFSHASCFLLFALLHETITL